MPFKTPSQLAENLPPVQHWENIRDASGQRALDVLASLVSSVQTKEVYPELLSALSGSNNRRHRYHKVQIKKKRGGERTLYIPEPTLRWVQRSLYHALLPLSPIHVSAHGFVPSRSTLTHAENHTHRRWLFITDIKDFFPSINWGRVYGMLKKWPYNASPELARLIANLSTYRGHLPQGAPTSPLLSNMICRRLDERLHRWARGNHVRYSRYADDLAFSSNQVSFDKKAIETIEAIIQDEGFAINLSKRRVLTKGSRQLVTGLVVNERKPNVPRELVKNLRALFHNVIKHGWESQVRRKSYFPEPASYMNYRSLKLPRDEFLKIQKEQRHTHKLISPVVRSFTTMDVPSFQKVVRGKLAYIAQVKGGDSSSYKSLDKLAQQAFGTDRLVADTFYGHDLYEVSARYYKFKRRLRYAQDKESLDALLRSEKRRILEFSWLHAHHPHPTKQYMDEILTTYHRAHLSPLYNAYFLRTAFVDGPLSKLLQRVQAPLQSGEVLQQAAAAFAHCRSRLPERLRHRISLLLKECRNFHREHPDTPPWTDDSFRERVLLPFKRSIRFDEDRTTATDLVEFLERLREKIRIKNHITLSIGSDLSPLFTDVEAFRDGFKEILLDSLKRSPTHTLLISTESGVTKNQGFETTSLVIHAKDPALSYSEDTFVHTLFPGDSKDRGLRKALAHLRGLVEWQILVSCQGSPSIEFDVMRNQKKVPTTNDTSGLVHRLMFYRYVP